MAAEAPSLHSGGKIRNTELFSCQSTGEGVSLPPSLYNGHFFAKTQVSTQKNFFAFFRMSVMVSETLCLFMLCAFAYSVGVRPRFIHAS